MHSQPTLKIAPASKNPESHLLILTHPKHGVPSQLAKALVPARFSEKGHPALSGERGAKLVLHGQNTVVILGIGARDSFTPQEAAEWGENAAQTLIKEQVERVQVIFPDDLTDADVLENFLKGLCLGNYRLEEFKTKKQTGRTELGEILLSGKGVSRIKAADFERIHAIVDGISFARDLVELPAFTANPQGIVERFRKVIDPKVVQLEVWDEKKIASKKMGLLDAVSKGSGVPPRFLIARYGKKSGGKTLFLVGKGVTFDTGGVNLKTVAWKELIGMKKDMGGAAGVLGAMVAISKLKPKLNIVAVTPLTTNQLGSTAINPGRYFHVVLG